MSDTVVNNISQQSLFMQFIPGYWVSWTATIVANELRAGTQTELGMRVSQDDLEAFIRVLRFNSVEEFHVTKEKL